MASLLLAGRFLSRAPLPDPGPVDAVDQGRSVLFYPVVGLLLGAVLAGLLWLLTGVAGAPAPPVAALVLGLWVWATGALHLDGLADCADAWVGGIGSRERTFRILKDPHAGTMAVVTLVVVLLTKGAALLALTAQPRSAALVLLGIPALARAQVLLLALTTPTARSTGMGAALRETLPQRSAWLAVTATWLSLVLLMGWVGLVAVLVSLILFWAWRRSMTERLGGFTGDTAGALVELSEVAVLLAASVVLPVMAWD